MQRATHFTSLYESVANIPPDIQQCLLTIAQFGCDPDQVKRWYNIVRHHFGVSEPESPCSAGLSNTMPPPQTPQKLPDSAGQIRPTSSKSFPISPQQLPTPIYNAASGFAEHLALMRPHTPVQELPLAPWPTPETGNGDSNSQGFWETSPLPSFPGDFNFSAALHDGMMAFTGDGLLPPSATQSLSIAPSPTNNIPFPHDFEMSSTTMPGFVHLGDPAPRRVKSNADRPRPAPPATASTSRTRPAPVEAAKKRRVMSSRETATMEPMQRPRRPSVPFRQGEPCPRHPASASSIDMSPRQPRLNASPMESLVYGMTPRVQAGQFSSAFPSPRQPSHFAGMSARRSFNNNGDIQPVVYRSPYV